QGNAALGFQWHCNHATWCGDFAYIITRVPLNGTVITRAIDTKSAYRYRQAAARLAAPAFRADDDDIVLIERGKNLLQPLLDIPLHGQQPVALPVDIGNFGDHIAADARQQAHRSDFIGQAARHVLLTVLDELVKTAK